MTGRPELVEERALSRRSISRATQTSSRSSPVGSAVPVEVALAEDDGAVVAAPVVTLEFDPA